MIKIINFQNFDELVQKAGSKIKLLAEKAITEKGFFSMALAGGNTPAPLYSWLTSPENGSISWDKIHLFWSDERLVPLNSELSNYRMAEKNLLSKISIPDDNVHIPKVEMPGEQVAADYTKQIEKISTIFDLIILGIGPDGHTASLFPETESLNEKLPRVIAVPPPKKLQPAVPRITFSLPLINQAKNIFFIASGQQKKELLHSGSEYPFKKIDHAEILFSLKK